MDILKKCRLISILLFLLLALGCRNRQAGPEASFEDIDAIFKSTADRAEVDSVEVYVDVSGSMADFVSSTVNTPYQLFLRNLEVKLATGFQERAKIFKFGNRIDPSGFTLRQFADPRYRGEIYQATATRLDFVLERIRVARARNSRFMIITDAETEGGGGARQNLLVDEMAKRLAAIFDAGLSLRIIGIKSAWRATQRPFYVFLIGRDQDINGFEVKDVAHESFLISKQLLKADSVQVDFSQDNSDNVQLQNADFGAACFKLRPQNSHRMRVAFKIHAAASNSYFALNSAFDAKPEIHTKAVVEKTEQGIRTVDANAALQFAGVQSTREGKNDFLLSFDIMPFNVDSAYVVEFTLQVEKSGLTFNLPAWIERWSTDEVSDFSKTYFFKRVIENLIAENLLRSSPFQLARFYLIL